VHRLRHQSNTTAPVARSGGAPNSQIVVLFEVPLSEITRWFVQRTADQSGRIKRIMIVAVARKLAIALWRYLEQGLVPQGAALTR